MRVSQVRRLEKIWYSLLIERVDEATTSEDNRAKMQQIPASVYTMLRELFIHRLCNDQHKHGVKMHTRRFLK